MKMEGWFLYALITTLAFGIYNFLIKFSVDRKFGSLNPATFTLVVSIAILVSTLIYGAYTKTIGLPQNAKIFALVFAAGILMAVGLIAGAIALKTGNASQVVPIYNANALITVLLAMVFLGEATSLQYVAKVVAGSVLIVAGVSLLV